MLDIKNQMTTKYKFFPKLVFTLFILTIIILFIRREEYSKKLAESNSASPDSVVVDSIVRIEEEIVVESKDLSSGLVAFYSLSGDAKDNSRYKNNGEIYGAELSTDRYNLPYNAYHFNGHSDYIKLPHSKIIKSMNHHMTATAWIYPEIYKGARGILGWDGHWVLYLDKLRAVGAVRRYPSGFKAAYSDDGAPIQQWSFVAMTYDGNKICVYTNGKLSKTEAFFADSLGSQGFRLYSQPMIGHGVGVYPQYFMGKIDEIYFYNRALNGTEIKALYDSQKPRRY